MTRRKKIPPSQESYEQAEITETVTRLLQELDQINDPVITEQFRRAISEVKKDGNFDKLVELTKYRRTPVDLEEFLYGDFYLGLTPSEMYPGVIEALHDLDGDDYVEAVMKGAIGGGKTTIANLGTLRQLYKISCLRHPQITFGVQRNSSLVFTIQSVRLSTAKKAVFQEMGQMMNHSPYFTKIYPYDKRITSEMIFREQHVSILPVSSSDTGAISMNVVGGQLDEMNFMQKISKSKQDGADIGGEYDQAKTLYLNLSKRRRSRFLSRGHLPGILFLVSSSRYPDDFTELKAAESTMLGGPDPQIYVFSKSLWESKGRDRYSPGDFRVVIGDERRKSRILGEAEAVPEGMETILVPEDFRSEFEKDIEGSIRDLAGRPTLATRPFIQNREALFNCMTLAEQYGYELANNVEEVDMEIALPQILDLKLRTDVKQFRVAHVDLALTGDAAGVAVGHIAGTKTLRRTNFETGETVVETLPVIAYDVLLRVVPPRTGEIDFSKIRQFLFNLREKYGIPLKVVTSDSYQSSDFRQILAKKGYATDLLSVDKTTQPYMAFREAIYDGRVFLPRHNVLIKELVELEFVRKNSKEKIDHKPNSCFVGDTRIRMADGSSKRIDEMKHGDQILTRDSEGRTRVAEAENPRETKRVNELLELTLENGCVIRCTPDHRFMLEDGSYKEARFLTDEDNIAEVLDTN